MTKSNRHILFEGKYKRLVEEHSWEFTERIQAGDIVAVLPVTDKKELVFIEQYRVPVQGRVVEFPAGIARDMEEFKNESLEDAARRELIEETGYDAQTIRPVYFGPASAASTTDMMTIFLATGLKKVGEGGGVDIEDIEVFKVPYKEVPEWLEDRKAQGRYVDTKVYAGLHFLSLIL